VTAAAGRRETPAPPRPSRLSTYLALGRVSNLPTVWTNVVAGMVLATGSAPPIVPAVLATAAMSTFYVGGMFLNDAFDRGIDAKERPERPIPAGHVTAREVFAVGFGLLGAGLGLAVVAAFGPGGAGHPAVVVSALGLAGAIVLYDAWHKKNPVSPVLMGICRMLVYVTAALAIAPPPPPWRATTGALSLLAYVIGLTYVAKQEQLGRLGSIVPLSLLAAPLVVGFAVPRPGGPHPIAWVLAGLAAVHVGYGVALSKVGGKAIGRAVAWLIAGISFGDAVLVASAGEPWLGAVLVLGVPATLGLQRWVRGT
jgi:4-hydroxybenzoate polyprenyltransferase